MRRSGSTGPGPQVILTGSLGAYSVAELALAERTARPMLRDLFRPLAETGRAQLVAVLGGLVLLTVYLYQGHYTWFAPIVGWDGTRGTVGEWYAHGCQFLLAFALMLVVPVLWIRFGLKEKLAEHGLCLGDWRFGLPFLGIAMVVLAIPLYINAANPEFRAEYPLALLAGRSAGHFLLWESCYLVYYIAWEFFFRGFWQIGLGRRMGIFPAMALQTAVSTVMHIGKPEGETMTAIVGGVALGLVAIRTRSILYVVLIHWYVGMLTDLFCLIRSG